MIETAEVAERALVAAGQGEVMVTVTQERSLTMRFARSSPTQSTSVDDVTVEVAALRDGHVGRSTTNGTEPEALQRCARAAVLSAEVAASQAGAGDFPGFAPPAPVRQHDGHDPETAALDPGLGGQAMGEAFAVAGETRTEASGMWTAAEMRIAIASSTGMLLTDAVTDAFVKVVAFEPGGRSGYGAQSAVSAQSLDAGQVARRAARKAVTGEVGSLPSGEYPVVMEPPAVHELLGVLAWTAFNGLAHAEDRGALAGKLGTRVVSPAVNISDSPRYASTLPRAFDAEGVPKTPLPLIQDGVAHRVVHDIRSAAMARGASTGHALAAGGAPDGPLPTNLVMIGGGAEDEEELCAPIERGIYVTRLWYTNVVRPRESLFTAVTRDGTFLIEDGVVTRPLADMRATDSALGILGRLEALGARSVLVSDGELYGRRFATGSVCPPVRVGGVRFTGSAAHP